jgi:hypothetical protein
MVFCWCVFLLAACDTPPATLPPVQRPFLIKGMLVVGEKANGQLDSVESRWYFEGQAGEILRIEYTGQSGAPPAMTLLNPSGESIARSSSGIIANLPLPSTGRFAITLGEGAQAYTLAIIRAQIANAPTLTLPPLPTSPPAGLPINFGQTLAAEFRSADALDLWVFEGQAGQLVSIYMRGVSPEMQPVIRLFDPARNSLIEAVGIQSAQISGFSLPSTGLYLVQTWGRGYTGQYALTLQAGVLLPTPTPTLPAIAATYAPTATASITPTSLGVSQGGDLLVANQPLQGQLRTVAQVDRYAFFGAAEEVISLGMFAEDVEFALQPFFTVYGPNGQVVAESVSLAPAEAMLSGFVLPVTGAYVVFATGLDTSPTGKYTLALGQSWTLREVGGGQISQNGAFQGQLFRNGDRETWAYDLPANAALSITVAAESALFNPVVELVAPNGEQLAAWRGGEGGEAVIPSLITPMAGRYLIRVTGFKNESVGAYSLRLEVTGIAPTATFAPVAIDTLLSLAAGQQETFTFEATSGNLLSISSSGLSGYDTLLELYGPSGRRLAKVDDLNNDGGIDAALQTTLDDGPGTYRVVVYGYALMAGQSQISIRVSP